MDRRISIFVLFCVLAPLLFCWAGTTEDHWSTTASEEGVEEEAAEETATTTTTTTDGEGQPKRKLQWNFVSDIIDASVNPLMGETYYSSDNNGGERYYSNTGSSSSSNNRNMEYGKQRRKYPNFSDNKKQSYPKCSRRGNHCHADVECCDSLKCDKKKRVCSEGHQCGVAHSHCHKDSQCCGALQCDQRIRECMRMCKKTGNHCHRTSECCGAGICNEDHRCTKCLPQGAHCHSSSECCGRASCNRGRCELYYHL
eukprot:GHVS01078798.1.p1 GENE.GHVS01078798.1~~GHVS01078798.1.p1  ORF type:complete len:255 (+),score=42.56 GHVS01078798.1:275-1039(+)